jgi:hypothetical protein
VHFDHSFVPDADAGRFREIPIRGFRVRFWSYSVESLNLWCRSKIDAIPALITKARAAPSALII